MILDVGDIPPLVIQFLCRFDFMSEVLIKHAQLLRIHRRFGLPQLSFGLQVCCCFPCTLLYSPHQVLLH